MLLVIITVREEVFPETYCWALQECTIEARRAAGWSAEALMQKIVRLPAAEFAYYPGMSASGLAADVPKFVLIEVLLSQTRRTGEKEAFWAEFQAGVEARRCCSAASVLLHFVEMPNLYFSRKAPPL